MSVLQEIFIQDAQKIVVPEIMPYNPPLLEVLQLEHVQTLSAQFLQDIGLWRMGLFL